MSFLAFGKNTVKNLLTSDFFEFKKIILRTEYSKDKDLLKTLEYKKIPFEILEKCDFDRYSFDKKNQGIVAFIKRYDYSSLSQLLSKKPNNKFPILVILDSIEDPHNFGAILRTLAAFDIDGIIISKKNQVPVNNTVIKVSVGGAAHVPVCHSDNLLEIINELKKNNYQIVSTVCDEDSETYNQIDFNGPTCLVFGNEHEGIRSRIIKASDRKIYIPMKNDINSLNVSVSCGIICSFVIAKFSSDL
jgi:23S rRNA (guanosine2251-2'-O)-methyltransferase